MLPLVLRAMQIAPKAFQYARKSKFMGKAEVVAPKALPAPKAVTAAAGKSSIRTALGNTAKIAPVGVASSMAPDNKPASNANSGAGTIDTSKVKTLSADDVAVAAKAMGAKVSTPKPKVVRVQTGGKDGTKTSTVSTGTASVGATSDGDAGEAEARANIKAQNNVQSVQGAGNMDEPQADPQFDAEIKNYEEYKAAGGDKNDLEGFSAWKKLKEKGQLNRIVRSGSGGFVRSGSGFMMSGE